MTITKSSVLVLMGLQPILWITKESLEHVEKWKGTTISCSLDPFDDSIPLVKSSIIKPLCESWLAQEGEIAELRKALDLRYQNIMEKGQENAALRDEIARLKDLRFVT